MPPPFDNPPFFRAALSVIACSDDTSPKGGGETWLSLWESWHDVVVTERAAFQGGSQRGRRESPPLELNYISFSPSHAGELSSYA